VDSDSIIHGNIATGCVDIPTPVITNIVAGPNPFRTSVLIEFHAEEDVELTVIVYDVTGMEIKKLLKTQRITKGDHNVTFEATEQSSQGLYDTIFLAKPLAGNSNEILKSLIKLQLLK
jgi:hypothetical protein